MTPISQQTTKARRDPFASHHKPPTRDHTLPPDKEPPTSRSHMCELEASNEGSNEQSTQFEIAPRAKAVEKQPFTFRDLPLLDEMIKFFISPMGPVVVKGIVNTDRADAV